MSFPPSSRFKKLRTKTGCASCRDRRKKCDERKPICATCERLGIHCLWPKLSSLEDRRERGAANSRWSPVSKLHEPVYPLLGSLISSPHTPLAESSCIPKDEDRVALIPFTLPTFYFGILSSARIFLRTNRELFLSTSYFESFLPANILPKAHANFSRLYLGDISELRNSMFACSSMQLANKTGSPPVEALFYYTQAVSGLRRHLNSGLMTGSENWLLVVTVLLHCFETWCYDSDYSVTGQFQHLLGAIQLLKLHCRNTEAEPNHELYILMAESVLFHVSTLLTSSSSLAIFNVDSDIWDWVGSILQKPAYDNVLSPVNHPVLGTPWELNKLVFEISKLSIKMPLTVRDIQEKKRLDLELLKWEESQEMDQVNIDGLGQEDPYSNARQLYIICARILILLAHTTEKELKVPHFQNEVQRQKSRAIRILQEMLDETDTLWNFLMRWPLLILGDLVELAVEREVIRDALERIWLKSSCGDVKRSLDKIQSRWTADSSDIGEYWTFPSFSCGNETTVGDRKLSK